MEEKWNRIKEIVQGAMVKKKIKVRKKEFGFKDWWNRCCTKKKREVQRLYRKWRQGKITRERYIEGKKALRVMQEQKQRERRNKKEEELGKLQKESDIWKFINKKRKKREWTDNNIGKGEWRKHFMQLLKGTEGLEVREEGGEEEKNGTQEREEITEEEIRRAVKKMKNRKAAGIDGIPMEA